MVSAKSARRRDRHSDAARPLVKGAIAGRGARTANEIVAALHLYRAEPSGRIRGPLPCVCRSLADDRPSQPSRRLGFGFPGIH